MSLIRKTLLAVLFLGCSPLMLRADLIATYPIYWKAGRIGVFEWITHVTYLSDEYNSPDGLGTLFEGLVINDGETRVDTASNVSDPDFDEYASLLTDGADWWLFDWAYLNVGGSMGRFERESVRLTFLDPNHTGPDLAGYEIESVTRTITANFDSPGSDPNGDGNWTDYEITGTFEIYGHPIPEPPALGLVALGASAWIGRKRRAGVTGNR